VYERLQPRKPFQSSRIASGLRSAATVEIHLKASVREALIQIGDDRLGLVQPGALAVFLDAQARHLDAAAVLFQGLTMFSVILGITQLHRQVEAVQGAPDLDAERAGVDW